MTTVVHDEPDLADVLPRCAVAGCTGTGDVMVRLGRSWSLPVCTRHALHAVQVNEDRA